MKQLIVLAAVLPLLLLFMTQYCLDQKNSRIMSVFQQQVYAAKEEAKQEGYFTDKICEDLRVGLADSLGVEPESVVIDATKTKQYRINYFDSSGERGLIYYKVSVPVDKIMAGGKLLGIEDKDNKGVFTVEGSTASECLP